MNIILVAPKLASKSPLRFDYAYWNFYIPLLHLKHNVHFFDSSTFGNKELRSLIDNFKPDLIFCIMTGDKALCPDEPWETISNETLKGNINTFNWFCDDSYRFDSFSKIYCNSFRWCSTPEKRFLQKYHGINYTNIVYATWHANADMYLNLGQSKNIEISFIGGFHGDRIDYLNHLLSNSKNVVVPKNKVSFEDMVGIYSSSKVCLNFTKDSSNKQTQMKARIFEVIATGSLLLTEYTQDLDNCFSSLLTFSNKQDLILKLDWINSNQSACEDIKNRCYREFLEKHDSKIRLRDLLESIV